MVLYKDVPQVQVLMKANKMMGLLHLSREVVVNQASHGGRGHIAALDQPLAASASFSRRKPLLKVPASSGRRPVRNRGDGDEKNSCQCFPSGRTARCTDT